MAERDGFPVRVRDPRDARLDSLNRQAFWSHVDRASARVEAVLHPPTEDELVEIAHRAYVNVPNEEHQKRMRRVVRAILKALRGAPSESPAVQEGGS